MELEKELQRLPKNDPSPRFCAEAKARLMSRIQTEARERWFVSILRKVGVLSPDPQFVRVAKARLMSRIQVLRRPLLGWWGWTKRALASTLALLMAVTSTLLFVEGRHPVNAAENSTLEVVSGDVSVKHPDKLIWDPISTEVELAAGDLVRTGEMAKASLHFFDDSELRLGENSILLINRMDVSPSFPRQGIIEVSLHQGQAWVQTLNVDDGYADFVLSTSNVSISAKDSTFDVSAELFAGTHLRVFRHSVAVAALNAETRLTVANGKLNAGQSLFLGMGSSTSVTNLNTLGLTQELAPDFASEPWIAENLKSDQIHLDGVRTRELASLKTAAGTLPGDLLYPFKRARERLEMVFTFGDKAETQLLSVLANQRLDEAMVLLGQGQPENAQGALDEYKTLVEKITSQGAETTSHSDSLVAVVASHKKSLVSALPGDATISLLNQALNQTQELLAENPASKAQVRLANSVDEITRIHDLVAAGELETAQGLLGAHQEVFGELLAEIGTLPQEQQKTLYESLLDAQYEEKRLLGEIRQELASKDQVGGLLAMAQEQTAALENGLRQTVAVLRPTMPEVVLNQASAFSKAQKAREFANKVSIYSTWQGQKNQVKRLIAQYPQYTYDQDFWAKVRDNLDGTARVVVESRISELSNREAALNAKQLQLKISRAIRQREARTKARLAKEQGGLELTEEAAQN